MGLKGLSPAASLTDSAAWLKAASPLWYFTLFTAVTLSLINHQRTQYQHKVEARTQKFTLGYISHLTAVMQQMIPLLDKPCLSSQSDITYQAAFTSGVRTFLLVKDGYAYCSSATGDIMLPMKNLYQDIDWDLPLISSCSRARRSCQISRRLRFGCGIPASRPPASSLRWTSI